jgi:rhamnosyltransferase
MKSYSSISTPPNYDNTCGVIVTFNPSASLMDNIWRLSTQISHLIIVDNASKADSFHYIEKISSELIEVIINSSNLGIAAALNQGLRRAKELGFEWIIMLDQDSRPAPDLFDHLYTAYSKVYRPGQICIIAPQIINLELDKKTYFLRQRFGPLYERASCRGEILESVTTVITSGSLISLDVFQVLGDFREDFFIDYVDTEFCLRSLSQGYKIIVACQARIDHVLGRRRKVKLGRFAFYPTFHPPDRWYYMSRNRIPMIRMYAVHFPHWFIYEVVATAFNFLRMMLTEDQRLSKLRAVWQGTLDGLRGRMGKRP